MRVKFPKGKQREFLSKVIENLGCLSLRKLNQFGFEIPYSTLKNYYSEARLLPKEFFDQLCFIAKIDINELKIELLKDNWGQIKGGRK